VNTRAICEGRFTLPMPVAEAVPLFTPEGERSWAGASWDPVYAVAAAAADDSAPGTVFTTESDGGHAIWIVLERRDDGMRYARVAPDRIAGTVDVTCAPAGSSGETEVTVTYDVTSLGPEGAAFVERLRDAFDAFLEHWRQAILAARSAG
jgi:polyketide cyclase/dehydrase/lipid transport protein